MNAVARFEKVTFERFLEDWKSHKSIYEISGGWDKEKIREIYDSIKLPKRSTKSSVGYDFYSPCDININFGSSLTIPSGIRCFMTDNYFLNVLPRSGQGFKYGIRLANTAGVIDADYYNAENEGHILIKLVNNDSAVNTDKAPFQAKKGVAICQGIFLEYGITYNDVSEGIRVNGFGSTGV